MRFLLLFLSLFLQVSASGDNIHVPRKSHAGMPEGTFVPAAKITEKEQFSTVTNYLGTPEAMYREDGETVWTCELNSYGKVRNFQGESKTMCPFRAQGQYEDAGTGLYYNLNRYYDPESGTYISQDPISIVGGLNIYAYVLDTNSWLDPLGLASRPNNGKYNIFFDHTVDAKHQYSSDAVQFNKANKEFINRMNSDPVFRRDRLGRYPELGTWLKNPNMSGSPAGLIWHHHEETRRLVLVDRVDHAKNHALYHPTGKGGRDIWGGGEDGRKREVERLNWM
jgi:RHS repeat-associated protein